jgi:hypothetical protein
LLKGLYSGWFVELAGRRVVEGLDVHGADENRGLLARKPAGYGMLPEYNRRTRS